VAALVYAGPMGLGRRLAWSPRRRLAAALCASSALAACGGVVWLLATHRTPVPHRLVDDLRIPAAAILAGGMYLAGPNRSLLAVALLPMAVVVAALWTEQFAPLEVGGWWFQAAVPAAVAQVAFVAADRGCRPRRSGRLGAVLATWFVMCLLAIGLLGVPGSGGMAAGALRIIAIAQCAAAALIWAGAVRCGLTHIA